MQGFLEYLNQFKNDFGLFWEGILLILGAVIPSMYILVKSFYKKIAIKIRLRNLTDLEGLNILRICSATPNYHLNDISIKETGKKLYIGFPQELKEQVLGHDRDFSIHEDFSFNGSSSFEDIIRKTEIPDLKELIDKHRLIVAEWFVNRENGCHFNRPKYGVYETKLNSVKGIEEIPEVGMKLFETDYFTHRVFKSIYQELKSQQHPISLLTQDNLREGLNKYNSFTTSLGLNALVIADSKEGESIIFSRRADGAAHVENKFKYNSTVMEGISLTDYDPVEKKVSLKQAMDRALNEELGLSTAHLFKFDQEVCYCDFFLEKNYFEIGITAMVKIDAVFEESIRDLPARDRELEISKLVPIAKRKAALEKFIRKETLYPQALFTLKMICAREMIFLNLKKS